MTTQWWASHGLTFTTERDEGQFVAVEPVTAMFGEGDTPREAANDLLRSLFHLRDDLRAARLLAPELVADLAFLNAHLSEEGSRPVTARHVSVGGDNE